MWRNLRRKRDINDLRWWIRLTLGWAIHARELWRCLVRRQDETVTPLNAPRIAASVPACALGSSDNASARYRRSQERAGVNYHFLIASWRAKEAESAAYRMMKRIVGLYVAWLIVAGLLVYAAVERHPYSFYTLLRWICCPVFAYSAFAAYEKNRVLWVWVFGVLAALYNPLFRVHLDRSTWIGVNWFTVGVIVVAAIAFWMDKKKSASKNGSHL